MRERRFMSDIKEQKLHELNLTDLIDRICDYPDQNLLDYDKTGNKRKFQAGRTAREIRDNGYENISLKERAALIHFFTRYTVKSVGLSGEIEHFPENFYNRFHHKYFYNATNELMIDFALTKETDGRVSAGVPTEDWNVVKIGYLDDAFVEKYRLSGSRIVTGNIEKGKVEIPFNTEKLYHEQSLQPSFTDNGCYIYRKEFSLSLIPEDKQNMFKDVMNSFPVKDMADDILNRHVMGNPITNMSWHIDTLNGRRPFIQIETDNMLNASQMVTIDHFFRYLQKESGWMENKGRHEFLKYMPRDDCFIDAVADIYLENNIPGAPFVTIGEPDHLYTVQESSDLVLTADDLKDMTDMKGDSDIMGKSEEFVVFQSLGQLKSLYSDPVTKPENERNDVTSSAKQLSLPEISDVLSSGQMKQVIEEPVIDTGSKDDMDFADAVGSISPDDIQLSK